METVDPKRYSKTKIDLAGIILTKTDSDQEKKEEAFEVLNNWRASHNHPLQVFFNRLKRVSQLEDSNVLLAQRLKRVPSILNKLKRRYSGHEKATMKLTQMQDIAGCRAVLSNVDLVFKVYKKHYLSGDIKHERVKVNDYILNPKPDGYRSIHLIYKYFSDKGKDEYNGLQVEIQLRSKLQHIWATAVETVGFFTKQAIKSNEGEEKWLEFFRLVSSAFAKMEHGREIEGVPRDQKELYDLIRKKEKELNVRQRMAKWAESIDHMDSKLKEKQHLTYYLLELDINLDRLSIKTYSKRQEEKALNDYLNVEKKVYGLSGYDVVLVGATTLSDLKKAYPNYFLDTKEFLKYLNKILRKNS